MRRLAISFIVALATLPVLAAYSTKYRDVRCVAALGFAAFAAFGIALATSGLNAGTATYGYSILIGIGLAAALVALMTASQLGSPAGTV